MHFIKNEISNWKIYVLLFLILGYNPIYCFFIYEQFTLDKTTIWNNIQATTHSINECRNTCSSLISKVDVLQSKLNAVTINLNTKSISSEPKIISDKVSSDIKNLQSEILYLSDKVLRITTENTKIRNEIEHTWKKRLLKLIGSGIRVSKVDSELRS